MTPATPQFRQFGSHSDDLLIDVLLPERPQVITEVLAACAMPAVDRETLWDFPVSLRIKCLLGIAALDGVEEIDADMRCAGCGQALEVTFTLEELITSTGADAGPIEAAGRTFRRPTGRDQLEWARATYPNQTTAIATIATSLALDRRPVDAADLPEVEARFDEADRLLRALVQSRCPDCGYEIERELDLAEFALRQFARSQEALLETVHLLASRYIHSGAKREILDMPKWRRARYVALLRREVQ